MSDFREEEALGKAYDARLARRLLAYLRPYRGSVVLALVLTILVGPLEKVTGQREELAVPQPVGERIRLRPADEDRRRIQSLDRAD